MSDKKRFRTSLFGFKKKDVNIYIERMIIEYNNRLKEKNEEISGFKKQIEDINKTYEELACKAEQINEDRTKIADVLLKAQEKAELMIEDAKREALEEKKKLENKIEVEKEKLVDIKHELKIIKDEAADALKKYEDQLSTIIGNDTSL